MRTFGKLKAYLTVVSATGLPLAVLAVAKVPGTATTVSPVRLLTMAAILLIGELRPIPVARSGEAGDEISISSTMACAMLFLAPVGWAVAAQAAALTADELVHRRAWNRLGFNIAQYSIALMGMSATYAAMTRDSPLGPLALTPARLPAALASSVVFFALNNGLTGVAVALKLRQPVVRTLAADVRWQMTTAGVLLALAPVVAEAVRWSVWSLPLLVTPLVAVHRSAQMAFLREREALHDPLTGLPNRNLFMAKLDSACRDLGRRPVAVMLLDLDHFKDVNDTLGHQAGDAVIVAAGQRLRGALREGDIVARLGGDEFAVLTCDVDEPSARELADRLLRSLHQPLQLGSTAIATAASVGVALAPHHGNTGEMLLRQADVALYVAKERRGIAVCYEQERDEASLERVALVGDLREALDRTDELFVVYQPKRSANGTGVVGLEALIRWRHPKHGLLPPDVFVPLAEHTGLSDQLTRVVLDAALAALAGWRRAGHNVGLAVNLSARQIDASLPHMISDMLARWGVPAGALTLEITESAIMDDTVSTLGVLRHLRDVGVRLSIDDFGTGYSSLAYLRRLRVDEVKIDREFVAGLGQDEDAAAIVRATITLGHHFGLHVVGEGVENGQVAAALTAMGCDTLQGYYICRPLPLDRINEWLAANGTARCFAGLPAQGRSATCSSP